MQQQQQKESNCSRKKNGEFTCKLCELCNKMQCAAQQQHQQQQRRGRRSARLHKYIYMWQLTVCH